MRHTPINVEAIEAFYSRHDISRETPGMNDTVIIRTAGIKEIKRQAKAVFDVQVERSICHGFSTFCNLRPVNVLLSRSTPHDMCLCQTHENFIRLANALLPSYSHVSVC